MYEGLTQWHNPENHMLIGINNLFWIKLQIWGCLADCILGSGGKWVLLHVSVGLQCKLTWLFPFTHYSSFDTFRFKMFSLADASGRRTALVALRNSLYLIPLGYLAYDCKLLSPIFLLLLFSFLIWFFAAISSDLFVSSLFGLQCPLLFRNIKDWSLLEYMYSLSLQEKYLF